MSGNGNGHHWSKFCWRDWQSDRALRACSLGARGFWVECLAAMHEGDPVGHLTFNSKPASLKQMAVNANCSEKEAKRFSAELEDAGVFSRSENGTIFSRRMVRDAQAAEMDRENGKKGGNPRLRGVNPPVKPAVNWEVKAKNLESEKEPPLTPPPSGGDSEGKILSVGKKAAAQAAEPPAPPSDREPTPAEIEANRKRTLEDIAAMPPPVADAVRRLANAFEHRYHGPGRWPELTRDAQVDAVAPPAIKPLPLVGAVLAAARAAAGVRVPA